MAIGAYNNLKTAIPPQVGFPSPAQKTEPPVQTIPIVTPKSSIYHTNSIIPAKKKNTAIRSDMVYKSLLAKNITMADGTECKSEYLKAVIGPNELIKRVRTLQSANFNPDMAQQGVFKADLHLHTTASDGKFTPETLFATVDNYVQNQKNIGNMKPDDKFLVAITDHDTVDGVKSALEYIAEETKKNPDRFKNIQFMPGIEFTSQYQNNSFMKRPIQVEVLGYCVNPFDKMLTGMLETGRKANKQLINDIIDNAHNKYGVDTSDFKEHQSKYHIISTPRLGAFDDMLERYLEPKGMSKEQIKDVFGDKFPAPEMSIYTPELEDLQKATQGAFLGIAHPVKVEFDKDCFRDDIAFNSSKEAYGLSRLMSDFKNKGVYAAEGNYQLPKNFPAKYQKKEHDIGLEQKIGLINNVCAQTSLLKTGGIDNHGANLYARR